MGKYKYDAQKKANKAKKKQKKIELKEIKLRPVTETHDYKFKIKMLKNLYQREIKLNLQLDLKVENYNIHIQAIS